MAGKHNAKMKISSHLFLCDSDEKILRNLAQYGQKPNPKKYVFRSELYSWYDPLNFPSSAHTHTQQCVFNMFKLLWYRQVCVCVWRVSLYVCDDWEKKRQNICILGHCVWSWPKLLFSMTPASCAVGCEANRMPSNMPLNSTKDCRTDYVREHLFRFSSCCTFAVTFFFRLYLLGGWGDSEQLLFLLLIIFHGLIWCSMPK